MPERCTRTMDKHPDMASAFACAGTYQCEEPYGSGHINDTYRVHYAHKDGPKRYIRQRMNQQVFRDIPTLMENIGQVIRHQRKKLGASDVEDLDRRVLTLIPTVDGMDYYQDKQGDFWRTYLFVDDAVGIDVVQSELQAFEAARTFGEFQSQLTDLPVQLHETIPNFHHTRSRFDAFMLAVEADEFNRAASVKAEIHFAESRESQVDILLRRIASGEIPERVTHNDTKLNNVLMDRVTGKGLCVIDLDTVMPGSVLYDFGDLVRTTTTTAAEDEVDLSGVEMNIEYFTALVQGYLEAASSFLMPAEKELLAFSGNLITFEVGLRFLTDYLQGDTYFKTHRDGQNRDRCRTQFKMVESMENRMDEMRGIVERCG